MRMAMRWRWMVAVLALGTNPFWVKAADWPQWLGAKRNGATIEKVAPWTSKDGPEVIWREKIGSGFSSPVVAAGKVFVHMRGADPAKEEEDVVAWDAKTGMLA